MYKVKTRKKVTRLTLTLLKEQGCPEQLLDLLGTILGEKVRGLENLKNRLDKLKEEDEGASFEGWEIKIYNAMEQVQNEFIVILIIVCSLMFLFAGFVFVNILSQEPKGITMQNFASFGDSFGILTALFSALAFAAMYYGLNMQREELILQREELKATRQELRGQKEEFEIQNKTLKIQAFNDSFFKVLNLFVKEKIHFDAVSQTNIGLKNKSLRVCLVQINTLLILVSQNKDLINLDIENADFIYINLLQEYFDLDFSRHAYEHFLDEAHGYNEWFFNTLFEYKLLNLQIGDIKVFLEKIKMENE